MDKHDNEKLENDRAPLRLLKQGFLILALVTAGGCASLSDGDDYAVFDTAEGFNRGSYEFTDKVDRAALVPVARGYRWITPDWIETGVANMFTNLTTITSSLNGFLQGKPVSGFTDLGRVLINTTIGVGGFFDPATDLGLKYQQEDFGQTLAVWGWTKSRYVYIPFMGPSTIRDLPSVAINAYLPRLLFGSSYPWGVSALGVVSSRAELLSTTDLRDASALDPYVFTRDAYFQRRKFLVYDGRPPLEDLFEDDFFEDDEDFDDEDDEY